MPDQARKVALRIAAGAAPRTLVLDGVCEATLVEDIVCDLAARGIVTSIEDEMGEDLLGAEMERLAKHSDTRASFAPRTATPSPVPADRNEKECAADKGSAMCESPEPGDVLRSRSDAESPSAGASLEDAVMREIGLRSPEPAQLGLPLDRALVDPASLRLRTSPPAPEYTDEGTPPHDQILAMAEATIVENTTYAEREAERETDERESAEPSIPIEESSNALALSDSRAMKTPLTAVTTRDEEAAGLPAKRNKTWPMVAFVAATGFVAWAVMHFAGSSHLQKQVETAPPAPVQTGATNENVTYTSPDSDMATGHGLLEISAPGDAVILVDGTERGRGGATLPLWDGVHDVRISGAEGEQHRAVEVRAGRVAHIKF
jgi:hypothetical protein